MADGGVTEQACERTHKALDIRLQEGAKRMSAHGEDIKDLKMAIVKLTQIQETQTKAFDLMTGRVKKLEEDQLRMQTRQQAEEQMLNKFWYSPTGQWIIKIIVITGVIITLTALGKSIAEDALVKLLVGK